MSTGCWFLTCFTVISIRSYIERVLVLDWLFDSWDRLNPNRAKELVPDVCWMDHIFAQHGHHLPWLGFAEDASCSTCPTGAAATNHGTRSHGPCDHGASDHGASDPGASDPGARDHGAGIWANPTHTVWAKPAAWSLACGVLEREFLTLGRAGDRNQGMRWPRVTAVPRDRGIAASHKREASRKYRLWHEFAHFVCALMSTNTLFALNYDVLWIEICLNGWFLWFLDHTLVGCRLIEYG